MKSVNLIAPRAGKWARPAHPHRPLLGRLLSGPLRPVITQRTCPKPFTLKIEMKEKLSNDKPFHG
jgi:predicted AlkP superfamily phosphohydrolase/phosphomutase